MALKGRDAAAQGAARRVILLGASNLTRGCHTVLQLARQAWGGPLDVLAAWGRGRSYGWNSRLFGRELPGIVACGLWPALAARPRVPLAALITDIGNDLLYGAETEQIAAWVELCVARLAEAGARTTMTMMPMANLETLSPARFNFFRRILFPHRPLELATVVAGARDLDARLRTLVARYEVTMIEQRTDWYGLDPIHLAQKNWRRAWREIIFSWNAAMPANVRVQRSLTRWLRLHALNQEALRRFGRARTTSQPVARLWNDVTLSLY
ncbi:MAG TPA: hypothetical protein VFE24_15055 [Pirellulales bacterium]|jgi:hypothetical protein|nr:hypothetical protein [Pirellulales bacterium]